MKGRIAKGVKRRHPAPKAKRPLRRLSNVARTLGSRRYVEEWNRVPRARRECWRMGDRSVSQGHTVFVSQFRAKKSNGSEWCQTTGWVCTVKSRSIFRKGLDLMEGEMDERRWRGAGTLRGRRLSAKHGEGRVERVCVGDTDRERARVICCARALIVLFKQQRLMQTSCRDDGEVVGCADMPTTSSFVAIDSIYLLLPAPNGALHVALSNSLSRTTGI